MMRIQILPLPSVVVGDSLEEPFALIVDQHTAAGGDDLKQFRTDCGARAVLVTPETVEVVDRYAETPPLDGQDQGEDGATREPNGVARLAEPWPAAPCPDWIREVEHPAHEAGRPSVMAANMPLSLNPEDAALKAARAMGLPTRVIADPDLVIHETKIDGIEVVVVPAKAKRLLIALGWTPPADPLAEAAS